MINDLTGDLMTNVLCFNKNLVVPYQIIPREYLTSRKLVMRFERAAIKHRYKRVIKSAYRKDCFEEGFDFD